MTAALVPSGEVERLWSVIERMTTLLDQLTLWQVKPEGSPDLRQTLETVSNEWLLLRPELEHVSAIGRPGFSAQELNRLYAMVFTVIESQTAMSIPMAGAADLRPLRDKLGVHGFLQERAEKLIRLSQ